ncbi:hypothetical protein Enr17x_41170 [Gimesia fumaroli]|uniref:Uncharacterized protein n=1 Tax=Gimesia fumaroli TaxID=2527976 RepID=A0A518IG53_9PLAN|nr:hypothetical protein Enr17x_41170 [Gimesia fumaroli]
MKIAINSNGCLPKAESLLPRVESLLKNTLPLFESHFYVMSSPSHYRPQPHI